jgi:hypothetical protein
VIAVFGKSAHWGGDIPPPAYYGGPVVNAVDEARKALAETLKGETLK